MADIERWGRFDFSPSARRRWARSTVFRFWSNDARSDVALEALELGDVVRFLVFVPSRPSPVATLAIDWFWWSALSHEERCNMAANYLESLMRSSGRQKAPGKVVIRDLEDTHPAIHAFMTELVLPNGAPRSPCSLLVVAEDGMVKAALLDRDTEQSLWASGDSLGSALAALEGRASDPGADWRRKRQAVDPKARKGKGA